MLAKGLISGPTVIDPRLRQTLFGIDFPNPLGLAAGFDKNGIAIAQWPKLGFGFVEVGTVTFHAQPGNEKPRMFRVPADQGLINRLGFNNRGAAALADRLAHTTSKVPLGINLGKSKITELDQAAGDYRSSYELLHGFGDYFVVNVSSPNTPGLRQLQDKAALAEIVQAIRSVDPTRPLFIKIAPDLEWPAIDEVIQLAIDERLTGIIATNTTIARDMLSHDPQQTGGLSGRPVTEKSNAVLAHVSRNAPKEMILIGVGGIMNGDDLVTKISLGAHLCQVYTGWIYGGPTFAYEVLSKLVDTMQERGMRSLDELRGSNLSS
jgi:dihydroorotate dehydrogenase